jgi:Flp pilus assembly protein TadG
VKVGSGRFSFAPVALLRALLRLGGDRRGNIAAMTALLIVPVVGALGMAIETGDWYMNQRAAQNVADSAAMSAGLNGGTAGGASCSTSPGNFDCEAAATASKLGFTSGANNVTVTTNCYAKTATGSCTTSKACPGGASQCYQVTVTKLVPISLMRVVGYQGDATIGASTKAVTISATAWSRNSLSSTVYCILGLNTSGNAISASGSPKFNSGGCSLFSDASTSCSGHALATEVDAAVTADSTCSSAGASGAVGGKASITDPWSKLATTTNIPDAATSCGGTTNNKFAGATISGTITSSSAIKVYCGSVTLSGNTTFTSSATNGTTIIIYNGTLDLAGFKFDGTGGNGTTIIFTGTTLTDTGLTGNTLAFPIGCTGSGNNKCTSVGFYPQPDGELDLSAPTQGTFAGIAVYVNPNLRNGTASTKTLSDDSIDGGFAGSGLTWNIQGLYYSPASSMNFAGAENKLSGQYSCFALVVKNFSENGTGSIFSNPTNQCSSAGLTPPTGTGATRAGLVG